MSELEFFDELPGNPTGGKTATERRAEAIKLHPGKWAKWPARTSPSQLKKSIQAYGTFEVVSRVIDASGKGWAFVRYVGNGKPATTPPPTSQPIVVATAPANAGEPGRLPDPPVRAPGPGMHHITCPGCAKQFPVSDDITPQGLARIKYNHRRNSASCDAIIQRRRNPW